MFGKIGAIRFNHNNINIESHLSSAFYETVTKLPKWLGKIGTTTFRCSNTYSKWHLSRCFWWNWNWIAQTIGKISATTYSHNNTNSKWHLSSGFCEIDTELPKWLEKLVPQHSDALTLTRNHACQVILMKLKLSYSNVWKNWCHEIQSQ